MLKNLIHIVWEISPSVPYYPMKIYPLLDSNEMKIQIMHMYQETLRHLAIWLPHFILNKHIHPFGIINHKNHCYMNYVIQLLFSILRTISQNFQFDSSTEGSISKFLFEIACSASSSTDVDVLKFRLVQYDKFYSGEQQEGTSECLMMLIEFINKGSVPYCGSNDNSSIGVFCLKSYFHICWKNILSAMHVGWDPPHLSLVACYILHLLVPLLCRNW